MADDETKRSLIEQFANVAGVDVERSRFFLEMTSWNLDLALTNFFESNEDSDSEVHVRPHVSPPPRTLDQGSSKPAPPTSSASRGQGARPANQSNIASLSSLRANERSDESSEEEGQAFYAGGSERTGQQILGPPRKKTDQNQLISSLFASAREHGAEEVEPEEASSSSRPRVTPFQGTAYRLGGPATNSEVIEGARVPESKRVDVVLKMWKNGFSLDDGPLREFSDPANREFLEVVMRNQVPRELVEQARGGEVGLSMEDHRNQNYVAPKKVTQSFSGIGHRLGSPTDAVQASPAVSVSSAVRTAATNELTDAESAKIVGLDADKPQTNIQIRLADGSRLVVRFNQTHRISDVRRYVVSVVPQYAGVNFVFATTFPNRELADEDQTLVDANLLNAVLVQKLK